MDLFFEPYLPTGQARHVRHARVINYTYLKALYVLHGSPFSYSENYQSLFFIKDDLHIPVVGTKRIYR
jgi:hypothetical protein